ncbi:hypothetical protein [Paraburkholderia sp. J11-2]|uniref:hypothetical protein n=1 Tax=Paraburkholderia sp. J11-2 TaxID=2805431 RepID=UPI002AB6286A|nr:hypothetical protein [Paraburkholderia sp. J11-2]
MKRFLLLSLLFVASVSDAQFTTGQILTAQQLNNQFALYLPLAGGALTGPLTVPTLTVTNGLTIGSLSPVAANTVLANATSASASPTAFAMPSCSSANNALQWTSGTGFTCYGSSASLTGATFTGNVVINNANAQIQVNDSSGTGHSDYYLYGSGSPFWDWRLISSSGLLQLVRYVSGVNTDQPISVSNSTGIVAFADGITVKGTTVLGNLTGTTSSIGGSSLAAGACATGTVAVSGATTSMAVAVSPVATPGAGYVWEGYVSAAGTVTVNVCAIVAGTPTATTYNVRVAQ